MQAAIAVLNEAYERLHTRGPEYGGDERGDNGLTNHGPMAIEVVCRRGLDVDVHRWLDRYITRLIELPTVSEPVTATTWRQSLGGGSARIGDWTAYFGRELAERPWRDVLAEWWPRLLPGIAAGSTHGVIRVGHAVRTLQSSEPARPALAELGHGLAFWAARYGPVPASTPAGDLAAAAALRAVPRLDEQTGLIAQRLSRLADLPGWPDALRALRAPSTPADVPAALGHLVDAATVGYLHYGAAAPVLLVHTATAPNAVLHVLPALPRRLWLPSFTSAWAATAAIVATYAPAVENAPTGQGQLGPDAADDVLVRAARHGDEHVLKFTDTAVEVYERTADPDALHAADRAAELIQGR